MANGPIQSALHHLRRRPINGAEPTDAELLTRFVAEGDQAAFAAIAGRHGAMVLGVCRRVLHNAQDAEDACQAAFLVLARKAAAIAKRPSLASWLHGVACRVALKLKHRPGNRERVGLTTDVAAPERADISLREAQTLLDEELRRLPERLRLPLVLCYLEGKTRDEAAAELAWSVSTLRGRLERGRKRLRARLERRGVTFPGLLAAGLLAPDVAAAVLPLPGSAVPSRVSTLADEVLRTMTLLKLQLAAALGVVALVVGTLAGVLAISDMGPAPQAAAQEPAPAVAREVPPEKAQPAAPDPDKVFADKVKKSTATAITALKKALAKNGTWENTPLKDLQVGGATALAMLALLEAGEKPDDPDLIPAINYLRKLEPQHTYVVGLQTAVFCRLNQKKDADLIRRNVAWLEKAGVRRNGSLLGWSYQLNSSSPDNSNTQYAVMGLHQAALAGFKPENKNLWGEIRSMAMLGQGREGGWGYTNEGRFFSTHTMTLAGLCNLLICDELIQPTDGSKNAIENGFVCIGQKFNIQAGGNTFYNLYGIARLGKLSGKKTFAGPNNVKHDWYQQGAEWLLKRQHADGHFGVPGPGADAFETISTSFAILFLSATE